MNRDQMNKEIAAADAFAAKCMPRMCPACWAAIAAVKREDPGSFAHGVRCKGCRQKIAIVEIKRLRQTWIAVNLARKAAQGREAEALTARLRQIEKAAEQFKDEAEPWNPLAIKLYPVELRGG
jgi:hypothetical protein